MEPRPTEREHELAVTHRQHEEESMRGIDNPDSSPRADATPPAPAPIPEPYPPDEIDIPRPDPMPEPDGDDADDTAAHSSRRA